MKENFDNIEPRGIPKEIEKKVEKNNTTEMIFVLDESGSMSGLEKDTIGGFNSMIAKQKKLEGKAYVTTFFFSSRMGIVYDRVPINKVLPLSEEDYCPSGSTALIDAIGGAITHVEMMHRYIKDEDIPKHTVFVITTDGLENASHKYTLSQVKEKIKHFKETRGWEFLFIGANIDAIGTASDMGISADRAVNYDVRLGSYEMYEEVGKTLRDVRACGKISKNWSKNIEKTYEKNKNKEK